MPDIFTRWRVKQGQELPAGAPAWLRVGEVYHGLPFPGHGSILGVKLFELGMSEGDACEVDIRRVVGVREEEV